MYAVLMLEYSLLGPGISTRSVVVAPCKLLLISVLELRQSGSNDVGLDKLSTSVDKFSFSLRISL